jgi:Arc/MetJ-type ribon-helix-helix transcriptional regulator
MKRVSLFIDEEQDEKLKKLAAAKDVSSAELVRRAIDLLLTNAFEARIEALEREVRELKALIKK